MHAGAENIYTPYSSCLISLIYPYKSIGGDLNKNQVRFPREPDLILLGHV